MCEINLKQLDFNRKKRIFNKIVLVLKQSLEIQVIRAVYTY